MAKKSSKKKSDYLRIKARLAREIARGRLLCDLKLSEREYETLAVYIGKCIAGRYPISPKNPCIACFLVASGIRYYDGSYWNHISRVCREELPYRAQLALGDAFYAFAVSNNMPVFQQADRVKNIMAHCFLPVFFREDLYSFLFYYYFVDLKCDITAAFQTNTLMQASSVSDGSSERMYMITRGTRDFFALYPVQAKRKLRRMLGVIDRIYKLDSLPVRASLQDRDIAAWCDRDETFRREAKSGNFSEKIRRDDAFSSPFTVTEGEITYLWLPSVIFSRDEKLVSEVPVWYLRGKPIISPALTVSISGCQTEVTRVTLDSPPPAGSVVSILYGDTEKTWKL